MSAVDGRARNAVGNYVPRNRDCRGLRLGLAIARRAGELRRGTIDAVNAVPGSRVTITLPGVADSTVQEGLAAME
jgi:signal transduction histidine kinase